MSMHGQLPLPQAPLGPEFNACNRESMHLTWGFAYHLLIFPLVHVHLTLKFLGQIKLSKYM